MDAWILHFETPVSYDDGVALQENLLGARQRDEIPDVVVLLEHEPVVTLGRRGRDTFLRATPEALQEKGVHFSHATRGGDVTYHAPGQVVIYPILRLGSAEADAHGYLHNLEELAIRTASAFGVKAHRRQGLNGAWTDRGKLAAIGFRLRRWITSHGMSFNVDIDLAGFDLIVGCGLEGERVTSLREILGKAAPNTAAVRLVMADQFGVLFGRTCSSHAAPLDFPADVTRLIPCNLLP